MCVPSIGTVYSQLGGSWRTAVLWPVGRSNGAQPFTSETDARKPLISIDQLRMVPVSNSKLSMTSNCHTPAAEMPSKVESSCIGWNRPVKGAVPTSMGIAASSSKIVPMKLSSSRPTESARVMTVPSGAIKLIVRSLSKVWMRLMVTSKSKMIGPDESIVIAEVATPELNPSESGISTGTSLE